MTRKISFDLFLSVWNVHQGSETPHLHLKMGHWLAQHLRSAKKRLLLMAFRGAGKSTLTGLFCAWLLLNDPELRILVVSADEDLAEQMLRHIRHILETHPLTHSLRPVKKTLWAADRLQVKRTSVSRDPSVRAAGITSNITGSRADIVICDDVEVPKTCDTHLKRKNLRQRLNELDFILTPEGMILYIGTPHTEESLYARDGFLSHYDRLEIKLTENIWPERFSQNAIDALRSSVGPRVFASQMMLQNISVKEAKLDPSLVIFYEDEKLPYPSRCVWDPAFGRETGDNSVIALVHKDAQNALYIHDMLYLSPRRQEDSAQRQCADVLHFLRKHSLRHIAIEANGLGQFLPGLLRRTLGEAEYVCAVQALHQSKPKNARILQAFEARLAAGAVQAHRRIQQTPFLRELRDWDPERTDNDDDSLDAAATAAHLLPQSSLLRKQFFVLEDHHD